MSVPEADIAHWKSWIGRNEARRERLDVEALRRFAAALGEDLDVERRQPSLAHWAFFLPIAHAAELGIDGHPKRGGLLPPVTLPRRMFAAADIAFHAPLALDAFATRSTEVVDLSHKVGRSGDLVLVQLSNRIEQDGTLCVSERQTIVYREAGAPAAPIKPTHGRVGHEDVLWEPKNADLFRFSAVTFNAHRIHYDLPYATQMEHYPGLVVHGPFIAARLFAFLSRQACPRAFSFRAVAPVFEGLPIRICPDTAAACRAIRADGVTAMQANAEY